MILTRVIPLLGAAASAVSSHVASPSYANTGGTGDRTASITVTWDGTANFGTPSKLVDGSNNTDDYEWTAGQTSKNLTFDFGSGASKVITAFKWYQSAAVAHGGSNELWGSNDNFSSHTVINPSGGGTTFSLNGSTTGTEFTFTNTTGYRYYRITVPGATSASPELREIEFKIDDA